MDDKKEMIDEGLEDTEEIQECTLDDNTEIIEVENNIENTKKVKKGNAFTDFIVAAVAAILVFLIMSIFITPSVVVGESMYPTYEDGDRFFVVKDWLVSDYAYGDVVCAEVDDKIIIKRVIGLPGDIIEIKDGAVYRNGEKVDESAYLQDGVETHANGIAKKFVVSDGQYFILGDNRPNSGDSRIYGLFDGLKGKVWFFYQKQWLR